VAFLYLFIYLWFVWDFGIWVCYFITMVGCCVILLLMLCVWIIIKYVWWLAVILYALTLFVVLLVGYCLCFMLHWCTVTCSYINLLWVLL